MDHRTCRRRWAEYISGHLDTLELLGPEHITPSEVVTSNIIYEGRADLWLSARGLEDTKYMDIPPICLLASSTYLLGHLL